MGVMPAAGGLYRARVWPERGRPGVGECTMKFSRGRYATGSVVLACVALAGCSGITISAGSNTPSSSPESAHPSTSAASSSSSTSVASPDRTVAGPDGAELRIPASSFPASVTPVLVEGQTHGEFSDVFGVGRSAGVVSVTADQQPSGPVELSLPYDPAAVPVGAVPVVFYFDTDAQLWLPVQTRADPSTQRLVATVDHFTDFTAAFLRVVGGAVDGAANGVDWFSYQVADAVGGRADEPSCGDVPTWVTAVEVQAMTMERNRPLYVCGQAVDDNEEQVDVKVALNRPYSLVLNLSQVPREVTYQPSPQVDDAVGTALTRQLTTGGKSVLVPARGTVTLRFDRGDPSHITGSGAISVRSLILDAMTSSWEVGSVFADSDGAQKVEAYNCAVGVLDQVVTGGGLLDSAGAWTRVSTQCLDPVVEQLSSGGGVAKEVWKKVTKAVSLSLLLGRAGQSLFDAGRALNEPHTFTLTVVPNTAPVPVSNLAGTWAGPVNQPSSPREFSVRVVLSPSLDGGTISYPGLGCSGTLRRIKTTATSLVFDETLPADPRNMCVDTVELTLEALPNKTVRYVARWDGHTEPPGATALLKPTK